MSESYELRDGYLKGRGAIKCSYRPQDYPELPFEVAKMGKGTEENVINFVRTWGSLKFDSVRWHVAHGQHIAVCLALIKSLHEGDESGLLEFLKNWLVPDKAYPDVRRVPSFPQPGIVVEGERFFCDASGHMCRNLGVFSPGSFSPEKEELLLPAVLVCDAALIQMPTAVAAWLLPRLVNPYLQGLQPLLVVQEEYTGTRFEFDDLLSIVYLHVTELASKGDWVRECEECGELFRQTDGRQRFCPPNKGEQYKESQCAQRHRFREWDRNRQGKRAQSSR